MLLSIHEIHTESMHERAISHASIHIDPMILAKIDILEVVMIMKFAEFMFSFDAATVLAILYSYT